MYDNMLVHVWDTEHIWKSTFSLNTVEITSERQRLLTLSWERGQEEEEEVEEEGGGGGGETRPHSFQRKEVFGGPGSKVSSVTVLQSMRNQLLTCLSHHTPSALTGLLSQHFDKVVSGLVQYKL